MELRFIEVHWFMTLGLQQKSLYTNKSLIYIKTPKPSKEVDFQRTSSPPMNSLGFLIGSLPYVSPIFHGFHHFPPRFCFSVPALTGRLRASDRERWRRNQRTERLRRLGASASNSRGSRGKPGKPIGALTAKTLSPNDSWDVLV